ncbi:MAG TPA: hypothetical protein DEF48_00090 [Nostoc sp. UBA8866]|nr:hypothetical protein DSM107007_15550 [Nostoc sp. PCC 7120 = FACHB-418]BAB75408.1 asl3709 [Nostoc sp. PCC 7120 = FACHB-418]HBW28500.1 hypothetical protein [Nostoc sp. UBA8866]
MKVIPIQNSKFKKLDFLMAAKFEYVIEFWEIGITRSQEVEANKSFFVKLFSLYQLNVFLPQCTRF